MNSLAIVPFTVFPIFWAVGAAIIFTDLNPIPETECGKTADEQAEELAIIRAEELKWAWRCLYALVAFITALIVAGVTVGVVVYGRPQ